MPFVKKELRIVLLLRNIQIPALRYYYVIISYDVQNNSSLRNFSKQIQIAGKLILKLIGKITIPKMVKKFPKGESILFSIMFACTNLVSLESLRSGKKLKFCFWELSFTIVVVHNLCQITILVYG